MIRLFIEDQELDVNQGFTNQITYAVDDLQNLDSKATAFSKTIVLPGTANNNRSLGNIFEFGAANFTVDGSPNVGYNFNASRSAKMKMEYNGVQVIKGTLRLLEIIIDGELMEYEVALFGELGGFFARLGNKKIEELDFAAYNHTYSIANITNSWNNANQGYGYYYPLIDYGNVSTDKQNYDFRAFRPAIFVKELFDKIITGNGYTWESNFFNTNFAKRLIIPNNQDRFLVNKTQALDCNIGYNWENSAVYAKYTFINIVGDTFTPGDYDRGAPTSLTYNATTATFNTLVSMQGRFYLVKLNNSLDSQVIFNVELLLNGNVIDTKAYSYIYRVGGSSYSTFSYTYNSTLILNTNDKIELRTKRIFQLNLVYFDMGRSNRTQINLTSPTPILLTP